MRSGKYRYRTALREHLPQSVAALIPKGSHDCGRHEWYKTEEKTWRCYHCAPGVTHLVPWDEREIAARQCEAEAMLYRSGLRNPDRHAVPHH